MPSEVFKRSDLRYFAALLAACSSHANLNQFAAGIPLEIEGNIQDRSTGIVKALFEDVEDTDAGILDLLNFLLVDSAAADYRLTLPAYLTLESKVLEPRGVYLTDDGYAIAKFMVRGTSHTIDLGESAPAAYRIPAPRKSRPDETPAEVSVPASNSNIFIVYGRDNRPHKVLETFLHFLRLDVLSWSDAVKLTGETQPHTYDVVKAGMAAAAAVIVVFSPDEQAGLRGEFAIDGDLELGVQPRQNVLLEAGMAFATAPEKTIFVQSELTRRISDIDGFNWVKLDGTWDSRQDLYSRLTTAGAPARPAKTNLMDDLAGAFKVQ